VNRPTGSTPGPQHDDLGPRTPSEVESPDRRDGRETDTRTETETETDETDRRHAEPTTQLPDGYEPL
jgi:hypothetical protein